ncbi:MAG: histidine ammonia-lyase [Woeseiaceae bacterium]|nr:histidine ammonia-lyase [Woeseiaceae bacterium]
MQLQLNGAPVTLDALRAAWTEPTRVVLDDDARCAISESAAQIQKVLAGGQTVYGVNTGFGQLAQERISDADLAKLQRNLVASHAVGVGPLLPDATVRLVMVLKVIALAQGYSGVREELVDALIALIDHEIYPAIPAKGSVGASGDLAPLAHLAGALLGLGEVSVDGQVMEASAALAATDLAPLELAPKEGLALLNGTQVSTALALAALFRSEHLVAAAITTGALAADAVKGSDTPFDERIQDVRGQPGQIAVARLLRELMHGSEIRASHLACDRVQDPYSIRCQPQVIGACVDVLRHVALVLQTEANAVTDNPLVFAASGDVLSGGNFHAEPVALAADYLALAIAEIGALSERRIALLIDSHLSGLPPFLVRGGGLNSGFMMAQVTAAALASENKSLAHPASVDSLPTSANQEDHVSMATFAASRLHGMVDNVARILAIELLAAVQGIEFHHPKKSSPTLEQIIEQVRHFSAPYDTDRSLSGEIEELADVIDAGSFCEHCRPVLPSFRA